MGSCMRATSRLAPWIASLHTYIGAIRDNTKTADTPTKQQEYFLGFLLGCNRNRNVTVQLTVNIGIRRQLLVA